MNVKVVRVRAAVGLFVLGGVLTAVYRVTVCRTAQCQVPAVLKDFTVAETYRDSPQWFQALYTKHGHIARVDIRRQVADGEATALINGRMHSMRSMYERRLSPYPGDVSHTILCDEPYRPAFGATDAHGLPIQFVQGFATSRLTFGACTDDLIAYRGLVAWYWCPGSQAVVQLEAMVPKGEPHAEEQLQQYLRGLSCRE